MECSFLKGSLAYNAALLSRVKLLHFYDRDSYLAEKYCKLLQELVSSNVWKLIKIITCCLLHSTYFYSKKL